LTGCIDRRTRWQLLPDVFDPPGRQLTGWDSATDSDRRWSTDVPTPTRPADREPACGRPRLTILQRTLPEEVAATHGCSNPPRNHRSPVMLLAVQRAAPACLDSRLRISARSVDRLSESRWARNLTGSIGPRQPETGEELPRSRRLWYPFRRSTGSG
jgi:hypothetical protein